MKKKHIKVLTEINKTIPKEILSRIMKQVDRYAMQKEAMKLAISDDEFPEEKKEIYRNLLMSGNLDIMDEEEDESVVLEVYNYIEEEVKKKIESGVLPKNILKEGAVKKTYKKTKQIKEIK